MTNPNDLINNLIKNLAKEADNMQGALKDLQKTLVKKTVTVPINGKLSEVVISNANDISIRIPNATDQEVKDLIKKLSDD